MSILAVYNNVLKSRLYKLTLDGKILGMRACIYNPATSGFDYYDFSTGTIKSKELQNFLMNDKSKFDALALIPKDGLLMTQEEVDNGIIISEFKDSNDADSILMRFIEVYKGIN